MRPPLRAQPLALPQHIALQQKNVIATAELYDRMEATSDAGAPNFALAEYKAPENYAADRCPLCKAGVPVTTF